MTKKHTYISTYVCLLSIILEFISIFKLNIFTDYSKQVKQRVSENFMYIHNLEERIPYTFSVRAQTIDYGPPAVGQVTTGPQDGSPGRPRDLQLSQTLSAIRLSWINGNSGKGPILGYYIESRPKGMFFFNFTFI